MVIPGIMPCAQDRILTIKQPLIVKIRRSEMRIFADRFPLKMGVSEKGTESSFSEAESYFSD
jgi:hypothetical protein